MNYTLKQVSGQIKANIELMAGANVKAIAEKEVEASQSKSPVATGSLRNSIRITSLSEHHAVVEAVGGDKGKSYASIQEYGNFNHSTGQRAYMGIADNSIKQRVEQALKDTERSNKI